MLDKLEKLETKLEELSAKLQSPDVANDMQLMTQLSKEYKELDGIVRLGREYRTAVENLEGARELLAEESDPEMKAMAKEEIESLEPKVDTLAERFKQALIPKDPNDNRNVVMEIRAGTGGDEAALFAGDLFNMYQRYAQANSFKLDVTDFHEGAAGGYKDVTLTISGPDAYGTFKFESGVHRVQRVPDTETQGRVHTSAATVAVLPEVEDFEIDIKESDIRKDTFMSSGNGGQSVNTTYSAVRLTHLPTGIVVSMQNERSQLKNLALAMKILKARLYDMEMQKRMEEESALRKSLVSSGDRSAKIRTYNFPQSRVTDHRINKTVYNLTEVLAGDLGEFIEELRVQENANRLAAMEKTDA